MYERLRGDRLEEDLNSLRNAGIKLREFIQYRFDRMFSSFERARQRGEDCEVTQKAQEEQLAIIRDLEEEIKRLKTALSRANSTDPEKLRRAIADARASLEKAFQQEIDSLRQKLKSRISQLESIRDLWNADEKKYQDVSARDQQRIVDLEKHIATISSLDDRHRSELTDQKRELDRLRILTTDLRSENTRLQRVAQDRIS